MLFIIGLLTVGLAGCGAVNLDGSVALDGLRPTADGCDPLAAPNLQVVRVEAQNGCPAHEVGMKIRPGMVLWLATPTWGPALGPKILKADQGGTDDAGNPLPPIEIPLAAGNRAPQVAASIRLPIRKLGPSGRLTDEEVAVLGTFLSLQRAENFGASDDVGPGAANTALAWRKMLSRQGARAALWNALVDASSLRRIVPDTGVSTDQRPLALVFSPSKFCAFASTPPAGGDPSLALTPDEAALLVAGLRFGTNNCQQYTDLVEVFALRIDDTRADPLATLAAQRGKLNPGYWLGDAGEAVTNPASIVSAELGAVSLHASGGAERRWSLAEWEQSEVCGADRRIARIGVPGQLAAFAIVGRVDYPKAATFHVEEVFAEDRIERRIVPNGARLQLYPALAPSDLARLRPADVNDIEWTSAWDGRGPDPCRR